MTIEEKDLKNLIAAQAADYFVTRSAGHGNAAHDQEFLEWLRTSPVHVAEYMAIAQIAKDARSAARLINTSAEALVAEARVNDGIVPLPMVRTAGTYDGVQRRWIRHVAAIIAVGVAIVVIGAYWPRLAAPGKVYATVRGEQRTLQLPDNTVIRLDSDSAISVAFSGKRRVIDLMRGQAYFEIAKDPARPFRVRAGEAVIDDVGTVFDVFRKSSDTVVTVIDGIVNIHQEGSINGPAAARQSSQTADLRAGDQATVLPSGMVETRKLNNLQKTTAWTRNEIVFEGESVASVVAEFNRYNRVQIVVNDPIVAALPITGVFRTFDVSSFAQFLSGLPNVRIIESDRYVTVSGSTQRDR